MAKRNVTYIVIALNVLYIAMLAVCAFFLGSHHPPPLAAVRSQIEASSSFEDLRPRALHIVSANEASDRAIGHLHETITHLIKLGIVLAAVNLSLLCFLVPRALRV